MAVAGSPFDSTLTLSLSKDERVAQDGPAEQVSLQFVSSNFFQALGAMPIAGRPFRDDDDRVGEAPVVIVSHRFWTRRLAGGADPSTSLRAGALDRIVR